MLPFSVDRIAANCYVLLVYELEITKPAIRALRRIPANAARRIRGNLDRLAEDPMRALNVKPLKGRPGYRLRVGDWRAIYELDHAQHRLIVLDIGPRGSVYDG
jgi:mRNA interferase RelE/StbE